MTMPLELLTIPCLKDNYSFLLHDPASGATAVVDVPEAPPILAALDARGWQLTDIWLTHHHWDHIDGVPDLLAARPARITGAAADAYRLPPLARAVAEGDRFSFGDEEVMVMDVSGHTVGHIAFHLPGTGLVFTGDSLMAMGCGRLFEGSPATMWQSLSKFAALPGETLVCSGHEYTASNMAFALSLEPQHPALISRQAVIKTTRAAGQSTVPSMLSLERETNPFLRANDPDLQSALGMLGSSAADVFTATRARKDAF
jgi:hydroxyacylglutathione hydrolase